MKREIQPDLIAKIHMYPVAPTGRQGTFGDEYWPGLLQFADGPPSEYWDIRLRLYEYGLLQPGDTAEIPIKFLNWDTVKGEARIGRQFYLGDPGKLGEGTILKVLKP